MLVHEQYTFLCIHVLHESLINTARRGHAALTLKVLVATIDALGHL